MYSIPPIPIKGDQLASMAGEFYFISNSNKFYLDQELTATETTKDQRTIEEIKEINKTYLELIQKAQSNQQEKLREKGSVQGRYKLAADLAAELKELSERKEKSIAVARYYTKHNEERICELRNQLQINERAKEIFKITVRSLTGEDGFGFKVYNFTLANTEDLANARKFSEGIKTAIGGLEVNTKFIHDTMSRLKEVVYYDETGRKAVFNHHYNEFIIASFIKFTSWLELQINKLAPFLPPPTAFATPHQLQPELTETQAKKSAPEETMEEELMQAEEEMMYD